MNWFYKLCLSVGIFLGFSFPYHASLAEPKKVAAVTTEVGVSGGGTESEHQQLRELKALYESAVSNNELDRLLPYLDEDFTFVSFTDSEFDRKKTSFDEFKKQWNETREKMLQGGSYTVTLDPERSMIMGDVAFGRGTALHKIIRGDGKTFELRGQWSAFLKKKSDGGWKVVRAHSSINAFDNSLVKDFIRSLLIKIGIIAGFAGFLIGGIAAFFFTRKLG